MRRFYRKWIYYFVVKEIKYRIQALNDMENMQPVDRWTSASASFIGRNELASNRYHLKSIIDWIEDKKGEEND